MKKLWKKPVAILLCALMLVGSVSASIYALGQTNQPLSTRPESTTEANTDSNAQGAYKDETVYVLAGADGSVEKIIVSDWIKNQLDAVTLTDTNDLQNTENVKGEETYTMNAENMRVWDAKGNDIYCTGTLEKALPVDLNVSYYLNGTPISPKELAGKSGQLRMRFTYKNNQAQTVEIDGKQEKIYVPFAMLTGMLLDNKIFSNVAVSNGRLVNDGDRTVVIGLAFPGLQESLALNREQLEIPDYVEITADVNGFEMNETITVATNEVFNQLNTEKLNKVDDLTAAVDKLSSSTKQLLDGSSALYQGLSTLLEKSAELVQGIDRLAAGAAQLNEGAEKLSSGLSELTGNNAALNGGAEQVFQSLLTLANTQLHEKLSPAGIAVPTLTMQNYSTVLENISRQLSPETVQEQVRQKVLAGVLQNVMPDTTVEMYMAAVKAGQIPAAVQQQIEAAVKAQLEAPAVRAQLEAALAQAKTGRESIAALKKQLDDYNQFYSGLKSYTGGVATAANGANELKQGAQALCNGILTLKNGAPALTGGVTELKNGAMKLTEGLQAFREQGVQKLADAVNGNLSGLVTRVKAVADVSKSYQSFSGLAAGTNGQVKFIYRTEAVENGK